MKPGQMTELEKIAVRNQEDRARARPALDRLVRDGHLDPRLAGYFGFAVACEENVEKALSHLLGRT